MDGATTARAIGLLAVALPMGCSLLTSLGELTGGQPADAAEASSDADADAAMASDAPIDPCTQGFKFCTRFDESESLPLGLTPEVTNGALTVDSMGPSYSPPNALRARLNASDSGTATFRAARASRQPLVSTPTYFPPARVQFWVRLEPPAADAAPAFFVNYRVGRSEVYLYLGAQISSTPGMLDVFVTLDFTAPPPPALTTVPIATWIFVSLDFAARTAPDADASVGGGYTVTVDGVQQSFVFPPEQIPDMRADIGLSSIASLEEWRAFYDDLAVDTQ